MAKVSRQRKEKAAPNPNNLIRVYAMGANPFKLNEEQKAVVTAVNNNAIVLAYGKAGTGKSLVIIKHALELLNDPTNEYKKIIITRPIIATEDLGYLPGSVGEKISPYMEPFEHFFGLIGAYNGYTTKYMKEHELLEEVPIAFMRGRNFDNCIVIADEIQNATAMQTKLILTRLSKSCKILFTGDVDQCDLKKGQKSGIDSLIALSKMEGSGQFLKAIELVQNQRNPLIDTILEDWKQLA